MINKENGFDLNIRWSFPSGREYVFAFITLFALLIVIYGNSFQGQFVFDDEPNILINENVHLKSLDINSLKQALYDSNNDLNRPLAYLSFGINYYLGRTNVFGYHLVNFIIHYLTAIFLFLFIFKTLNLPRLRDTYSTTAYSIALLATVFWAISPMQVTAVTYIVQRMASMAGLFYLMAMYFYLLGRTSPARARQIGFLLGSIICAMLSFASKENAAMLPLSVFLYDLLLIQGVSKASLKKNLAIAALPLAFLVLLFFLRLDFSGILKGYESRSFTLMERLLTQPRIIFFYISQLLYPLESHMMLIHDFPVSTGLLNPITTILSIMGITGAIIFAVVRSAKYPLLAFAILFFFINHSIEGSFIPLELIYEHRNYIPSFFFFVPIAIFIIRILDYFSYRRLIQVGIVLLLSIAWIGQGHTVIMRNNLFHHPLLLWIDNTNKAPALVRTHNNLGKAYWNMGRYEEALAEYKAALTAPHYSNKLMLAMPLYNMGRYHLYVDQDPEKARDLFEQAISIYPAHSMSHLHLVISLTLLGEEVQAREHIEKDLKFWYQIPEFQGLYSLLLLRQDKIHTALRVASRTSLRNPENADVRKVLGECYRRLGHYAAARKQWQDLLDRQPKNMEAAFALLVLADCLKDDRGLGLATVYLLKIKGAQSWYDLFHAYHKETIVRAFPDDPATLLPLIMHGVDQIMERTQ